MSTPYNGATYRGETFAFPLANMIPTDDESLYYRSSSEIDRTLEMYNDAFGFDFAIFAGKTVLDLGAGVRATFAQQAREVGVNAIAVNPNWRYDEYTENVNYPATWSGDGMSVAGIAQQLPFKDESFDAVVSLWGVPTYLPGTKGEYRRAFSEIGRVLKPGGIGMMYPISRTTVQQPAFAEVLHESSGTQSDGSFVYCELLDAAPIPKLMIAKEPEQNLQVMAELSAAMDRMTPAFL